MLPDFRLELPSPAGEPELRLAELKICGAVKRWYPCDGNLAIRKKKGVERRFSVLPEKYRKPLAKLDQMPHHNELGQVGSLERRLKGYAKLQCLVIGAFQEGARTTTPPWRCCHDRLQVEGSECERSTILSDFRRELSLAGAKAYSSCLLGGVARVGEEHRNTARRRAWVLREDIRVSKCEKEGGFQGERKLCDNPVIRPTSSDIGFGPSM